MEPSVDAITARAESRGVTVAGCFESLAEKMFGEFEMLVSTLGGGYLCQNFRLIDVAVSFVVRAAFGSSH